MMTISQNPMLVGTAGPDIVDAGPGNDTMEAGDGRGNNSYDGGEDSTKLIYPQRYHGSHFQSP